MKAIAQQVYPELPLKSAQSMLSRRVQKLVEKKWLNVSTQGREKFLEATPEGRSAVGAPLLTQPVWNDLKERVAELATEGESTPELNLQRPIFHLANAWILYGAALSEEAPEKETETQQAEARLVMEMMAVDRTLDLKSRWLRSYASAPDAKPEVARLASATVRFVTHPKERTNLFDSIVDIGKLRFAGSTRPLLAAWGAIAEPVAIRHGGSRMANTQSRRLLHDIVARLSNDGSVPCLHWAGVAGRALALVSSEVRGLWEDAESKGDMGTSALPSAVDKLREEYAAILKANLQIVDKEPDWEEILRRWMRSLGVHELQHAAMDQEQAQQAARWLSGTVLTAKPSDAVISAVQQPLMLPELLAPLAKVYDGDHEMTELAFTHRLLDNQDSLASLVRSYLRRQYILKKEGNIHAS
jgi:DNA-binding MarR family transcriptional regulator